MDIMGWACGTPRGEDKKKCIQSVVGKPEGKWEHQGQIGWVTVKWILKEIGWESVEWINLLQDKDMRQVFINALTNL
jgi:hypothetical protein